ncbi:ferredoxin [Bacillus sp. JCM 19041]|uniref:ferredoxin n=1 Tax=Bacillus sp. JCM 19041 TaxID=1460637 RepID=UPI0006D1334D
MKRYAIVEQDTCIGCGICEGVAPTVIRLDEEGLAYVTIGENRGAMALRKEDIVSVLEAVESCPTDSLKVSETPFTKD